jgi:small conductance mechanosensitive channel
MTHVFKKALPLFLLTACLLCVVPTGSFCAEKAAPVIEATPAEIEAVISTLETPAQREELIRTLRILAQSQPNSASENQVKSAATQLLRSISAKVGSITDSVMQFAGIINEIPTITRWLKEQIANQESRQVWSEVAINLALTLGLGYLAFYLLRLSLLRTLRSANANESSGFLIRTLRLFGILIVNLLPVVAFAIAAYLTIGIISPREKTRLVALAWINCFIISHTIIALLDFVFAPQAPNLRLSGLADENANYLMIWGKRLTLTTLYGYFSLQAALLLGLPAVSYEVLLRLLGLHITALIIIMILQNREAVSLYILQLTLKEQGSETVENSTSKGLRRRLANSWHILALFYVVLLYGVWALRIPGGFLFLLRATVLTVLSLLVIKAVLMALRTLFTKGFRISEELVNRFPGLEKRANKYISSLHTTFRGVTYFLGTMTILQAWGLNTFGWISSEPGKILGGTIISVFSILLITFLIWEITNTLIENSISKKVADGTDHEVSARTRTLLTVARKALAIVLTVISSLMVLSELGVNIAPLLAGAGVLGLAVGFGSQKLVQDVITGVFILIEDQIAVGDVVDLGGMAGVVEAVSIRTVRLRDVSGTVHTIPFSAISTVSNKTKDYSFAVLDVGIAYRESVDDVMQVLKDLGDELLLDPEYGEKILEPLEILGVDAFADSAVMIKARIKTVPTKQWWIGREFNRRMKNRFDELDIEIPFPHQTIYFGIDKKGQAPSARLALQSEIARAEVEPAY